ncbi:MAG: hypothetical protein C3F02_00050 [Parcubacteria group bacterium]|nr:MAG: hypothetical protein C3F02_00050 [Parcubacteria group bacterium]
MKIILATPLYPPEIDGLAVYSQELAERLKTNYQLTILAYANQAEKITGANFVIINKHRPLAARLWSYTLKLFTLAGANDLIYALNAVASGLPAVLVGWLRRRPVVINFFEDEPWKRATALGYTNLALEDFLREPRKNFKVTIISKIQGWVLRRASVVLVSSQALATVIEQNYNVPAKKIIVNYLAPPKDEILPLEMRVIPQQIMAGGPLFDWAGYSVLLHAVAELKNDFGDLRLIISGEGPEREKLEKLVAELNIKNQVIFLGQVSRAENYYWRHCSQIYVHNFIKSDFSERLILTLAGGTPLVAAATPLARELIVHQSNGLLVKPGSLPELTKNIRLLLTDESLRRQIISEIKKNLTDIFSWVSHQRRLDNLFSSLKK